ncbi:MAG TPA: hypothetical protein V6C57_08955 [Coleofasciculaceae cyanobacterium]
MTNGLPPLTQVIQTMLGDLGNLLNEPFPAPNPPPDPAPSPPPNPGVSLISVVEKPVGLGNRLGNEVRNSLATQELKGIRLDAMVRFQLWATELDTVDHNMDQLHGRILSAKDTLRTAGFLRIATEDTALADFVPPLEAWRKTMSCSVLYEFEYADDASESLITRIPIQFNSEYDESTTVTDEMVRWDEQLVPSLMVRGLSTVHRLPILFFVPGAFPTGQITFTRTFDGAVGLPIAYPSLDAFHTAIARKIAPDRHGQVTFASLDEFLAAFSPMGDAITLGDWDVDHLPDSYQCRVLTFEPPVQLLDTSDRFEITYQGTAFDQVAVIYLRVLPR